MFEKKRGVEKLGRINDYHNQVKELYRPVPSETKKFELEILKKQRETVVREKQPY